MAYERAIEQFVPHTLPAGCYACGKVNGVYDFEARIADGAPCRRLPRPRGLGMRAPRRARERRRGGRIARRTRIRSFRIRAARSSSISTRTCSSRTSTNACQEGFDSSELLKRFSTIGMGPSQGKHSNMNALRILARLRGEPIERLGMTTARPMFHPVPLVAPRRDEASRRSGVRALDAEHEALRRRVDAGRQLAPSGVLRGRGQDRARRRSPRKCGPCATASV